MNIFYVIDGCENGGREKVVADLANYSFKEGCDVTILLLGGSGTYSFFLENGINVKKFSVLKKGSCSLNPVDYIRYFIFLKKNKPDIIHYHIYAFRLLIGVILGKMAFLKCINIRTVHTSGLFYDKNNSSFLNHIRILSEKIATKLSRFSVIGISNIIHSNNILYFSSQTHSFVKIHNGLDVSAYYHQVNNIEPELVTFVYVARLVEGKNHCFMLCVWAEFIKTHKKAKLLVAGDGELKDQLLLQARDLNIQDSVSFLGHVPDINLILASADIALFPSSYEGFSITLLEYFASSLAVIAHDIPAFNEISENGSDIILIPLFDKEKYLEAMSLLYFDISVRNIIGNNARSVSERYRLEVFQEAHMSLYRKLTCGGDN